MREHKTQNKAVKSTEPMEVLGPGEIRVVAKVKLLLNYGKLAVKPGDVIILGPSDREAGVHIENLVKNGGVVPYESEEQAQAIRKEWEEVIEPERRHTRFGPRR